METTQTRQVTQVRCRMFPDLVVLESMDRGTEQYAFVHGVTMFTRTELKLSLVPDGNDVKGYYET